MVDPMLLVPLIRSRGLDKEVELRAVRYHPMEEEAMSLVQLHDTFWLIEKLLPHEILRPTYYTIGIDLQRSLLLTHYLEWCDLNCRPPACCWPHIYMFQQSHLETCIRLR